MEGSIAANTIRSSLMRRSARVHSDVFSQSSRDQDEEALKWVALEKLPTYDRIRKAILMGSTGEKMEINVENLGVGQKKQLLERLVQVAEEDNEKFLLKLKSRLDQYAQA